jgi:hypothetical protein
MPVVTRHNQGKVFERGRGVKRLRMKEKGRARCALAPAREPSHAPRGGREGVLFSGGGGRFGPDGSTSTQGACAAGAVRNNQGEHRVL